MGKKSSVKLAVAALLFSASVASAMSDVAQLVIERKNGKVTEETVKMERISKNTLRLKIPYAKYSTWFWDDVKHIDVITEDSTAQKGDDGYWIMAEGLMGSFKADNGSYSLRKNRLPIYGVKKGNEAFVGIVKGLQYEYSMNVDVRSGLYKVFPRFHIAEIGMPIYEDIVIDYTYFKGKKANYSSMGRAYRNYQLERGEVLPLRERIKGNPRLKYSVDAIYLKFSMATFMRKDETKLNRGYHWKDVDEPNIQKLRDYDNMMESLKTLKKMGIEKADIILTNWNWRSNGRCPIYGVAEPELGGNAKCRQLTALGKELGFQVAPHILHTENYTISPAFDKNDLALQLDGSYIHYDGMGGEAYRPCFKQVYYKQVLENYTKMQQLGFNGPLHIDVTSAITPYPCFDLSHPITRKECAYYMNQIGLLSRAFFGGFTSESGCDHVANTLDFILYAAWMPEKVMKKNVPLADRIAPLWQIAYHGIIMSNPFFTTIGYNMREPAAAAWPLMNTDKNAKQLRLKFMEFGGRLSYYGDLTKDSTFAKVKEAYDEYQNVKYLQLEYMDFHDEIAPEVFLTVYSDGSRIVTNYSKKPFVYNGQTVAAEDYKLLKPQM